MPFDGNLSCSSLFESVLYPVFFNVVLFWGDESFFFFFDPFESVLSLDFLCPSSPPFLSVFNYF